MKYEKNVKIAVIGAGYWGKNLIRNYHELGVLHLICDTDRRLLAGYQKDYPGVNVTDQSEEVFDNKETNAVAISTPANTHHKLAMEALRADKNVFVEKPLCLDVKDGEQLARVAKEKNLVLMVGHLLQYHPAIEALKALINQGKLGRLQYIYSNRVNLGKIRAEENILWSFAPHDISVILSLTQQAPEKVSSYGSYFLNDKVADVTLSHLTFSSGISAHIFVSWLHPFKEQKLIVVGDQGMAVFDDTVPDEKLLLYPHEIKWIGGIPTPTKKAANVIKIAKTEPLRNECQAFISAVSEGHVPYTDAEEGLSVLKVLTACQLSIERGGKMVELEVDRDKIPEKNKYHAHEAAVIDGGCKIGDGTRIWRFSHIMKGSVIGGNCNIGQNVVIGPNVSIGSNCKIQNNVSVYEGVTLEDDVFCGPSMVFTNVINPRAHIRRMDELKPTLVQKGSTIGANATIMCGVTLGRYCLIGAGAVVLNDVPEFALVAGNPAVQKGWVCRCGMKLAPEDGQVNCEVCGADYKYIDGQVVEV